MQLRRLSFSPPLSLALSVLLFLPLGCSALVSPDDDRLGGGGGRTDIGTDEDTGPIILMDGGTDASDDAMTTIPPPPDAVVIDTAPGCMDGSPSCTGEIVVECIDGEVITTDCAAMSRYCDAGQCHTWECSPGTSRCDGGDRVATCDDRGAAETSMGCPFGCDSATATCNPMPLVCPGVPPLALGAIVNVDTCGTGDDSTYEPTPDGMGCPNGERANGGDIVYAITLAAPTTVVIDLRDDDGFAAIDTVVYLRTNCDDGESQIACSDDIPCGDSDFPCSAFSPTEVRQSRIVQMLAPGTYYVVIDSINYRTRTGRLFTCGNVLLRFLDVATPP